MKGFRQIISNSFSKKNNALKRIISISAVTLIFTVVSYWTYQKTIPVVYLSRAQKETAKDVAWGLVKIREHHRVKLRNERSGVVKESLFSTGDKVKKGQVLMTLDPEEYEIDLTYLTTEKEISEKLLKLPKPYVETLAIQSSNVLYYKDKLEQGKIPPKDLKNYERDLELLKKDIERDELKEKLQNKIRDNKIEKIKYDIKRMTIVSPIDGVIVNTFARKGDLVDQSQVLFEVIGSKREVIAELNQEDFHRVKKGLPATVKMRGFKNQIFPATVSELFPVADPENEKYEIYLNMEVDNELLIPGLTGEVEIVIEKRENAIIVPTQALVGNKILKANGSHIESVEVVQGFRNMIKTEIIEGVDEGDIIVTERSNMFKDGQLVRKEWE